MYGTLERKVFLAIFLAASMFLTEFNVVLNEFQQIFALSQSARWK